MRKRAAARLNLYLLFWAPKSLRSKYSFRKEIGGKFQAVRLTSNRNASARDRRTAGRELGRSTFYVKPIPAPAPAELSPHQRMQIAAAAQWVSSIDRDQFWAAIAAELKGREISDAASPRQS